MAAVGYAVHGFSETDAHPVPREDGAESVPDGVVLSFDIGLVRQGMVLRIGSAKELKDLPRHALEEMVRRAITAQCGRDARKDAVSLAEDDYLRTLDAITERLEKTRIPGKANTCGNVEDDGKCSQKHDSDDNQNPTS